MTATDHAPTVGPVPPHATALEFDAGLPLRVRAWRDGAVTVHCDERDPGTAVTDVDALIEALQVAGVAAQRSREAGQ